ncbi:MAG: hypothetical protein RDV41_07460 [Planctomycetota bacterium]|nr:hypothetical protein [Planctomycetota bacterium]
MPEQYGASGSRSFYIDDAGLLRTKDMGSSEVPEQLEARSWEVVN